MKKRFFIFMTLCLLLSPAGTWAFDLENYRAPDTQIRCYQPIEGAGYVAGLYTDAEAGLTVVRRDAQGNLVYRAKLPHITGEDAYPSIDGVYSLADGRDAALVKQLGASSGYWVFFIDPAGEAQRGVALPPPTSEARLCETGVLTLSDDASWGTGRLTLMDWAGNEVLLAEGPEWTGKKIGMCAWDGERLFVDVYGGVGAYHLVCLDRSGVQWSYPSQTGRGFLASLLPDGEGGVYALSNEMNTAHGLLHLDAQGEPFFQRTLHAEGAIMNGTLCRRRGELTVVAAVVAESRRYYRACALTLDETGDALRLDARDFSAWGTYGYGVRVLSDGSPALFGTRYLPAADGGDTCSLFYLVPYLHLPQAWDVGITVK